MSATTTSFLRAGVIAAMLLLGACAGGEVARLHDPAVAGDAASGEAAWSRDLGRAVVSEPVATAEGWLVPITNSILLHVDASDGGELWKRKLGGPPVGSPVVIGERVFVSCDEAGFEVAALALATGKVLWKRPALGARLAAGGEVLIAASRSGRVVRLAPATGDSLWSVRVPEAGWRPPLVIPDRGLVVVPTRRDSVIALDASTGGRLWAVGTGPRPRVASRGEHLATLSDAGDLQVISLGTGKPVAALSLGGLPAGDPLLDDGMLIVALAGGVVRAFDLPGLGSRWSTRLDPPLRAGPSGRDARVLQPGAGGRVHVLDGLDGGERGTLLQPELLITSPVTSPHGILVVGERGTATLFVEGGSP